MEQIQYHIYPIHKTKTFWHFPNRLHDRTRYSFPNRTSYQKKTGKRHGRCRASRPLSSTQAFVEQAGLCRAHRPLSSKQAFVEHTGLCRASRPLSSKQAFVEHCRWGGRLVGWSVGYSKKTGKRHGRCEQRQVCCSFLTAPCPLPVFYRSLGGCGRKEEG
jgi:hypothetical protein